MFELRWYVETWIEYDENRTPRVKTTDPELQYRAAENPQEIGLQEPIWSEWEPVPTYIEKL